MKNIHKIRERSLAQILVDENLIEPEHLTSAQEEKAHSDELLIDIILENDYVGERDLAKALVKNYQLPFLYPGDYHINKDVREILPRTFLHAHKLYPLDCFSDSLTVVTSGNLDEILIHEIETNLKKEVALFIALHSAIKKVLKEEFPLDEIASEVNNRMDELFGSP